VILDFPLQAELPTCRITIIMLKTVYLCGFCGILRFPPVDYLRIGSKPLIHGLVVDDIFTLVSHFGLIS